MVSAHAEDSATVDVPNPAASAMPPGRAAVEELKSSLSEATSPEQKQAALEKFRSEQSRRLAAILAAHPPDTAQDKAARLAILLQKAQSLPAPRRARLEETAATIQQLDQAQSLPGGKRGARLTQIIEAHRQAVDAAAAALQASAPAPDSRVAAAVGALRNALKTNPDAAGRQAALKAFRAALKRIRTASSALTSSAQ